MFVVFFFLLFVFKNEDCIDENACWIGGNHNKMWYLHVMFVVDYFKSHSNALKKNGDKRWIVQGKFSIAPLDCFLILSITAMLPVFLWSDARILRCAYSISAALITAMRSEINVDSEVPPGQASNYKLSEVSSHLSSYFNLVSGLMPFSH